MAAIKSYKGFDKNLKCRDFQYEIGKEYEMDGEIKVCNRGFHACESPFDVFDHYTMIDSRFCEVEQDGNISKEDRGTKICSSKIKIKAELKLADMINLGVEWLKEITSPEKIKTSIKDNSSGNGARLVRPATVPRLVRLATMPRLVRPATVPRLVRPATVPRLTALAKAVSSCAQVLTL